MRVERIFAPPVTRRKARLALVVVLALITAAPIGALIVLLGTMSPLSYSVAGDELVVRSGDAFAGTRTVRLADISEASVTTLSRGRRTAGTALPGRCTGRFSYPELGSVWQATNCRQRVLVIHMATGDPPLLITPPDLEAFATAIRSQTAMTVTLPPEPTVPLRVLQVVLASTLVAVVAMGAGLVMGPHRMRYRISGGNLEILTLFGRKRWPVAGATAAEHQPERLRRVLGTAAPGYYTGYFRESGRGTRVYATDIEQMVLFQGASRLLVSPADRRGFLAALAEEGALVQPPRRLD